MDQNTEKKFEIKDKLFLFFKQNRRKLLIISFIFLLIPFLVIMIDIYQDKKNKLVSEKYIQANLYLSLKERIRIREVSRIFEKNVKTIEFNGYKLENRLRRVNTIEQKLKNELICEYTYNDLKLYKQPCIHYYFRVMGTYDRCVGICSEERLGYVYHSLRQPTPIWYVCNKRYIPYCINCFQKWQITNT